MAKELPYFKFEPSEYIAGNIQDCSYEAQGVFINICSLYWIRLGELPYASALQRICKGIPSALQELCDNGILSIESDQIVIEFLDEQLNEFQNTSEKRRNAANKRWSNASAMQVHSKSNAIREDKTRVEKKRVDKIIVDYPFDSNNFKNVWNEWKQYKKEQFNFTYKSASTEKAALTELLKITTNETTAIEVINQSIANGWKGFFDLKTKNNGKNRNDQFIDALSKTEQWKHI